MSCMTSVNKRKHAIEGVPKHVIENFYYNWDRDMRYAFNNTPYPDDYPRQVYDVGRLTLKGKHMTFKCLSDYCKEKGIMYDER